MLGEGCLQQAGLTARCRRTTCEVVWVDEFLGHHRDGDAPGAPVASPPLATVDNRCRCGAPRDRAARTEQPAATASVKAPARHDRVGQNPEECRPRAGAGCPLVPALSLSHSELGQLLLAS